MVDELWMDLFIDSIQVASCSAQGTNAKTEVCYSANWEAGVGFSRVCESDSEYHSHTRKSDPTPFDNAFRSLIEKCRKSTILLINEMFRETGYLDEEYDGSEEMILLANESFGVLHGQDSNDIELDVRSAENNSSFKKDVVNSVRRDINSEKRRTRSHRGASHSSKRITDSRIRIISRDGVHSRDFHLECQSTPDQDILIRIFEYDIRAARDEGRQIENRLTVAMPHSAVLYLRSGANTSDEMQIEIRTPGGSISYSIPVLRIRDYGVNAIIKRKLYFLIPFYTFTVCSQFQELNENPDALARHLEELDRLVAFLLEAVESGELTLYEGSEIRDTIQYVEQHLLTNRYKVLKKEIEEHMGGHVIEFRTDRIWNQGVKQGLAQGLEQGMMQGQLDMARRMFAKGMSYETIRSCVGDSISDVALHTVEDEVLGVQLQG